MGSFKMDIGPLWEAMGGRPGGRSGPDGVTTDQLDFALAQARDAHRLHADDPSSFEELVPCGCAGLLFSNWLAVDNAPLRALEDDEGLSVPSGLPPVIDAHVHAFPDRVLFALWRWFERHGWPIRYQLLAPEIVRFQLDRGVSRVVLLSYAHRPELARPFNAFLAELAAQEPRAVPLGTVHPLDPDASAIVGEIKALGLRGLKLHCHVQGFAPDDPRATPMWSACEEHQLPVVIHAGREPRSPAYSVDTYAVCDVSRIERVLLAHPRLSLCVPHLGANEEGGYVALLDRFENLYLDTTMMLAGYFGQGFDQGVLQAHSQQLMFGTDFPNLPYAWDRELRRLISCGLSDDALGNILGNSAERFFGLAQGTPPLARAALGLDGRS